MTCKAESIVVKSEKLCSFPQGVALLPVGPTPSGWRWSARATRVRQKEPPRSI